MGVNTVIEAPPEQRAQVAKEETAGFVGGAAGASLGVAGVALVCTTGWGCVVLGVLAAGGMGFAGDKAGRNIVSDKPADLNFREDDKYIYYPGEQINKETGRFEFRPGPKW